MEQYNSKFEENLQAMCIKISMTFPLAMTFEAMSLFMAMQLESLQVNQLGFGDCDNDFSSWVACHTCLPSKEKKRTEWKILFNHVN